MLKVTTDCSQVQPKYPMLKISDIGQVVIFTSAKHGTLLDPGRSSLQKGHYSSAWADEMFVNFYGSVTLLETKE
jgi:hypothetical protein